MKFKINKSIILVTYIFVSSSLFSQNNLLKGEIIAKVIDSIEAHNQLEFDDYQPIDYYAKKGEHYIKYAKTN